MLSGSNLLKGFGLDSIVHETTNRILLGHHITQGSHKSSDIVHSVIVRTTTSEGDGCDVVCHGDVLDSRGTSDCELHNEKRDKGKVKCFEWDASPPLSLSVVVVGCLAVGVSVPTVILFVKFGRIHVLIHLEHVLHVILRHVLETA
jgi:hypothetical protein